MQYLGGSNCHHNVGEKNKKNMATKLLVALIFRAKYFQDKRQQDHTTTYLQRQAPSHSAIGPFWQSATHLVDFSFFFFLSLLIWWIFLGKNMKFQISAISVEIHDFQPKNHVFQPNGPKSGPKSYNMDFISVPWPKRYFSAISSKTK